MGYSNVISRTDASMLIPLDVSREILQAVPESSAVMKLARRLPNMSVNTRYMPVTTALATAYFVSGDTGLKQTTEVNWSYKNITAEELAVIVPIPEAVLDDSNFDIWGEIKPQLVEAFGIAIDNAVLYGTNIPASWTVDMGAAGLVAVMTAASSVISAGAYTDLYEALMGETAAGVAGLLMLLEADGFMATGHLGHTAFRGKLRNVRDGEGNPIFHPSMQTAGQYTLDGAPILFPTNGAISSTYWDIVGQWDQLVYAMRQDITYKVLTEAVIQDAGGNIVYNLAQQDMVALRAVMRLGFALPNPLNRMQATALSRCAFAALTA
jgi:HK97 family phage major capsid protein